MILIDFFNYFLEFFLWVSIVLVVVFLFKILISYFYD
jgi:hypothetical protein